MGTSLSVTTVLTSEPDNVPPVGPGFPPSKFQMPTLNLTTGTKLYLSVVETMIGCNVCSTCSGLPTKLLIMDITD